MLVLVVFVVPSLWIKYAPSYNQTIQSEHLDNPVEIMRELNGFAHIFGDTYEDTVHGLGHVHCEDRLFKMVFMRLAGQGRLSEYIGEDTIELDEYFLRLGLDLAAEQNAINLTTLETTILTRYSNGVNECAAIRL